MNFLSTPTKEEILNFIESLINSGVDSIEEVLEISTNHFGKDFSEIIEYIVLNDEEYI
jgi:hypothetical protein